MNLFGKEPTVIVGIIMTLLSLAVSFGLKLSGVQLDLISSTLTSLIPLISSFLIRTQVTPTAVAKVQIQEAIDSPKGGVTVAQVIKEVDKKL